MSSQSLGTIEPRILARASLIALGAPVKEQFADQEIEYLDIAPQPIERIIPLVELFERVRRLRADAWQIDFCSRLEEAFLQRHIKRVSSMIHAEPQLGKSTILANVYPAWMLGHDPMHRIVLATYNVTRSQMHSKAVRAIMQLPVYRSVFTNLGSQLPSQSSIERWKTEARRLSTDPQDSFNPVGLQSGLTGSGFDTLIIDDPYADQKEAFSETTRANLQDFWEFTVKGRRGDYSNVFGMFHRYHVQDLAGYLLDSGEFDYWRYASECDGDYIHKKTGQRFADPLGRNLGEFVSERRDASYYADKRANSRVWNSLFQGRPAKDEGEFFQTAKINKLTDPAEIETFRRECVVMVRSWDLAATEEGGDYSVGSMLGMRADRKACLFNIKRKQLDTAGRDELQRQTAIEDGSGTIITVPQDPGAAGKSTVYYIRQNLKEFNVTARPTSANKVERARPLSGAVNSGDFYIAADESMTPDDEKWLQAALEEMSDFPLSEHDDIVDTLADAYNEAFERVSRGKVIKNFRPERSLKLWSAFKHSFKTSAERIPAGWMIYAAVKLSADESRPNSAVIAARAPENTELSDTIFVVAEYKEYTGDPAAVFEWIDLALDAYCESSETAIIWLHPASEHYSQTLWQKLNRTVSVFSGSSKDGIAELDWYCLPSRSRDAFADGSTPTGLYLLIGDTSQIAVPSNEYGLIACRDEFQTWHLDEKGEPNGIGSVLDCLRMITYCFRTIAAPLTLQEKLEKTLPEPLRAENIAQVEDDGIRNALIQRRAYELNTNAPTVPRRGGRMRRK